MGCACKVTQKIDEIQRVYGTNKNPIKTDITGSIKVGFKKFLIALICIPFIPLMLIFVGVRWFFTKKTISIKKIFKLGK